jgi:CheY-like chemotaxis protein
MTYDLEQNYRPVVLVVEDHEDTRDMLRIILEREGYAILEVADGLEAVEVAGREHPDLVLMDGSLPGLDGLSATRLMLQQESLRDMPIVALSGHAEPEFQAAAHAAGCAVALTKPLDFAELRSTLRRLLPLYSCVA